MFRDDDQRSGLSRRDLLKGAAGAVAAAAGIARVSGQVQGTTTGGGAVPLRLPMGALDSLDRKQYIKNMEIHAHLPGAGIVGGEPLTSGIWAKGAQRRLTGGVGFGGGFIDITDPRKPAILNKDAYQGLPNLAYNTKLKKWIVMSAGLPPLTSPTPTYPRGKYHKEYFDRAVNSKAFRGIRTYDATDPAKVVLLQEFSTGETGSGTHQNFYDGGKYAYLDCGWDDQLRLESTERPYSNGLMIVDVSDPARIQEVSRWWVPGQRLGEEEEYRKFPFAGDQSSWTSCHGAPTVPKRVEDGGTLGYGGFGHFGMYIFDFSDITKPKVVARVTHQLEAMGGIPWHTCYPTLDSDPTNPQLKNLVIGVFESLEADCREPYHTSYVVDVKNPRSPKIIGLFPRPEAPPGAPYDDFCQARGRFSAHNIQSWLAPGVPRNSFVAFTYFNAGVRIYDIRNPQEPQEVAYFVPPRDGEMNDFESWRRGTSEMIFVEWDRNLIWLSTHEGLYCLSTPSLGKPVLEPRKVTQWSVPHLNVGWDDQTPRSVYFGRSLSEMV
jgi:hypothetical protein